MVIVLMALSASSSITSGALFPWIPGFGDRIASRVIVALQKERMQLHPDKPGFGYAARGTKGSWGRVEE